MPTIYSPRCGRLHVNLGVYGHAHRHAHRHLRHLAHLASRELAELPRLAEGDGLALALVEGARAHPPGGGRGVGGGEEGGGEDEDGGLHFGCVVDMERWLGGAGTGILWGDESERWDDRSEEVQ